eukprot:2214734-Pleurochrysis_carterae.AAC.1
MIVIRRFVRGRGSISRTRQACCRWCCVALKRWAGRRGAETGRRGAEATRLRLAGFCDGAPVDGVDVTSGVEGSGAGAADSAGTLEETA